MKMKTFWTGGACLSRPLDPPLNIDMVLLSIIVINLVITDRIRRMGVGNVFSLSTPGGGVPWPGPEEGTQPGLMGGTLARSDGGYSGQV